LIESSPSWKTCSDFVDFAATGGKPRNRFDVQAPMIDWFETISASGALVQPAAQELQRQGFTVIHDALSRVDLQRLSRTYDVAMSSASGQLRIGSTSTRLGDVVNLGEEIDALYVFPPLLDACRRVIGRPFKLSSLHARTLHPHSLNGKLHVDVQRDSADWPLVGFILMVDEFRPENGATRFVPGSHRWSCPPDAQLSATRGDHVAQVQACGPAGSLIVFDGSAWHDHAANTSDTPRRSIQGAFIPREGKAAEDFAAGLQADTRARLSPVARYVLAI
jgi:hypothetical protein